MRITMGTRNITSRMIKRCPNCFKKEISCFQSTNHRRNSDRLRMRDDRESGCLQCLFRRMRSFSMDIIGWQMRLELKREQIYSMPRRKRRGKRCSGLELTSRLKLSMKVTFLIQLIPWILLSLIMDCNWYFINLCRSFDLRCEMGILAQRERRRYNQMRKLGF